MAYSLLVICAIVTTSVTAAGSVRFKRDRKSTDDSDEGDQGSNHHARSSDDYKRLRRLWPSESDDGLAGSVGSQEDGGSPEGSGAATFTAAPSHVQPYGGNSTEDVAATTGDSLPPAAPSTAAHLHDSGNQCGQGNRTTNAGGASSSSSSGQGALSDDTVRVIFDSIRYSNQCLQFCMNQIRKTALECTRTAQQAHSAARAASEAANHSVAATRAMPYAVNTAYFDGYDKGFAKGKAKGKQHPPPGTGPGR